MVESRGDESIKVTGKVTQAALLDFFRSSSLESVDDAVATALLAFLYGVLIPGEGKNQVDIRFFHLAQDLAAWNAFPWGRLCYGKTIESLRKAVSKGLQ